MRCINLLCAEHAGVVRDCALRSLEGKLVMIRTANKATAAYINRQGGVRLAQLLSIARQPLCWTHTHLLSIRAAYIPGVLNRGADIMSRGVPNQETGLCTTI